MKFLVKYVCRLGTIHLYRSIESKWIALKWDSYRQKVGIYYNGKLYQTYNLKNLKSYNENINKNIDIIAV
jgi:hypothetical protein